MLQRSANAVPWRFLRGQAKDDDVAVGIAHRKCFAAEISRWRRDDFDLLPADALTNAIQTFSVAAGKAGIVKTPVLTRNENHSPQLPLADPAAAVLSGLHIHRIGVELRHPGRIFGLQCQMVQIGAGVYSSGHWINSLPRQIGQNRAQLKENSYYMRILILVHCIILKIQEY
jgi:hypothetical protein